MNIKSTNLSTLFKKLLNTFENLSNKCCEPNVKVAT